MDELVTSGGSVRSMMLPQRWHWQNPQFTAVARALQSSPIMQKRVWEWVMIATVMDALGARGTALGIGVGNEPLIRHAAKSVDRLVCSDMWRKEWLGQTGKPDAGQPHVGPSPLLLSADARALPVAGSTVGLLWSCSSIEHFGHRYDFLGKLTRRGIRLLSQAGLKFPVNRAGPREALAEIARVLKPNAAAIISTGIVLNSITDPEFFGFHEFLALMLEARLYPISDLCSVMPDAYFSSHVLPRSRMRAWNDPLPQVYLE